MTKGKTEEADECLSCSLAVAIGTSLRVCKKIGNKKKCKELYDKVTKNEISPEEVFKQVRKMAEGHDDEIEVLDEVDRFIKRGKYAKTKRKKKRKNK